MFVGVVLADMPHPSHFFAKGGISLRPPNSPAVPRAEHQSCHKSRHSFCEARGIGSAALQGQYNPLLTLSVRVGFRSSPCLCGRFFPSALICVICGESFCFSDFLITRSPNSTPADQPCFFSRRN